VDGVEEKLTGKAEVIRLDVFSRVGRQAAARYGVRGIPAFVVVDGSGQAAYSQVGLPRSGQLIEQVEALLASK
jgi:cytochrome c-type biogenesis protein